MSETDEAYKITFDDIRAYCSQTIAGKENRYEKIVASDPEGACDCVHDIAILTIIAELVDKAEQLQKAYQELTQ